MHAASEYVFSVGVNQEGAEFIGNKHTHSLTHSQTYSALLIYRLLINSITKKLTVRIWLMEIHGWSFVPVLSQWSLHICHNSFIL